MSGFVRRVWRREGVNGLCAGRESGLHISRARISEGGCFDLVWRYICIACEVRGVLGTLFHGHLFFGSMHGRRASIYGYIYGSLPNPVIYTNEFSLIFLSIISFPAISMLAERYTIPSLSPHLPALPPSARQASLLSPSNHPPTKLPLDPVLQS